MIEWHSNIQMKENSELRLGNRTGVTEYGVCYDGQVMKDHGNISVTLTEPIVQNDQGAIYLLAPGAMSDPGFFKLAVAEVNKAGHTAVVPHFTNAGIHNPLDHNARDIAAVLDALPPEREKRAIGVSMGAAALVLALRRAESHVDITTLVAPADIIPNHVALWPFQPAIYGLATIPESIALTAKDPITALIMSGINTVYFARRPFAVTAEILQRAQRTVRAAIIDGQAAPDATYLRLIYGDSDRLFPPKTLLKAVEDLPFDEVVKYHGGHFAFFHDPKLARQVIELDDQLAEK